MTERGRAMLTPRLSALCAAPGRPAASGPARMKFVVGTSLAHFARTDQGLALGVRERNRIDRFQVGAEGGEMDLGDPPTARIDGVVADHAGCAVFLRNDDLIRRHGMAGHRCEIQTSHRMTT